MSETCREQVLNTNPLIRVYSRECGLPLEPWPGPCVTCGKHPLAAIHMMMTPSRHPYAPPKRCAVHKEEKEHV